VEVSIDLLEGELDQEFEKDLEIWLNSSEGSTSNIKEELEILSQIRQSLKDSDDVAVPESGLYYDALEARIMGALDQAIESGRGGRSIKIGSDGTRCFSSGRKFSWSPGSSRDGNACRAPCCFGRSCASDDWEVAACD
jgi:hypothetical protein